MSTARAIRARRAQFGAARAIYTPATVSERARASSIALSSIAMHARRLTASAARSALRRRALHTLKPLPYAADALAPHLSSKAIELHRAAEADLVAQLNTAIAGTEFEHAALPELVAATSADAAHARVGNLASEVWNHELY